MFQTWDHRYLGGLFDIETYRCPNGLSVAGAYKGSYDRTLYVGYSYREAVRTHRQRLRDLARGTD